MDTTELTAGQQAGIERTEEYLLSGYYFTLIAQSAASRYGYQPPVGYSYWSAAMTAVAKYGSWSDRMAETAFQLMGKINLYGTEAQAVQKVAEILSGIVRTGWYDTIGATGPEPGRPSSHQHATKLRDALYLAALMDEVEAALNYNQPKANIGWALKHLIERENLTIHACYLPRVAKALAE